MQTVVVTGAGRGIGLGLARRFLRAGWRVFGTHRDDAGMEALAGIASQGELHAFPLEVTDADSVAALGARLANETVDVLVHNAGVIGGRRQDVGGMDYAAWLHAFDVNTLAPFRVTTALLPSLRRSPRPRVVTLSSQMGALAGAGGGYYAYRSSKAAVNKVMQVLAGDLRRDGIVVCPVHPGWVRTDMGGAGAEISVEESADGLFALIESLTPAHSGRFWTWEGKEHPW